MRNAIGRAGRGTPVRLSAEDFEVERTETLTSTATVLALDLSLSMPMRDNFLAAKKVAMALHSLITTQFPRDYLGLVGFGELARELRAEQLPEVSWDYTYGTNMQHALMLARRMLARQSGTKQVIMITDGEPTAHILPGGQPFFSYPPAPETIRMTLAEVARATREGIRINTFMLDATGYLRVVRGEDDPAQPGPGVLHHARDARGLRPGRLPGPEAGPAPVRLKVAAAPLVPNL